MKPADFPDYEEIADALLALLMAWGGSNGELRPDECYEPLGEYFGLTKEQRTSPRPDGRGGSAWENTIQWARQRLINHAMLDGSTRGVWRITALGRVYASGSQALAFFREPES